MQALLFGLLMVFSCLSIEAQSVSCTAGTATGAWQQLTLPSAMTNGGHSISSMYAAHDCYLYVSMYANGLWRAKVSDLRNSPTTAGNWTWIDSGFPAATINVGTGNIYGWTEDSKGNIYAGIGNVSPGAGCSTCVVGKWNGSTSTFSATPPGSRFELRSLAVDAKDNIFLSDLQSDFYESTDGGATFKPLVTDAYAAFGQTSGWVYEMTLYNGQIYWGGEGGYMQSPESMASANVMYGGGYTGNVQVIVGDGTATTSPTYLLAGSRFNPNGFGLSRYVVATNTWTDLNLATNGIPQYDHLIDKALVRGTAHEYLAGWQHNVYQSLDDGVTWSVFAAGLPAAEQVSSKQVAISPFDDSKYLITDTAATGQRELWYYPVTSTSSTGGGGTGGSGTPVVPTLSQQTTIANTACGNISVGLNGSLNGFVPSPNDAWHQDISALPVDPLSSTILTSNVSDLAGSYINPNFGTLTGIPYNVVDSLASLPAFPQVQIPMTLSPSSSDLTYYPVETGMVIEGNPVDCPTDQNSRRLIVIDRRSCANYELFQAAPCKGSWSASNGLMFDLLNTEQRPYGMASADASGLSVFEGLVRYDEIVAGSIQHAIRFTAPNTKADANGGYFVAPATHAAGNSYGTDNLMGMRVRLQAGFDVSGFSPTNQIILNAMKKYGLILTDNGPSISIQGTQDSRWNNADLANLKTVLSGNLEVVQMPTAYDASTAPTGAAPVIQSLTYTTGTYQGINYVLLTGKVTGASYSYLSYPGIDNGAIFRGYMAIPKPAVPTTYTLTSRNAYGTTTATILVP